MALIALLALLALPALLSASCGDDVTATVGRVTPQALHEALAAGTAVVVDVRGAADYDKGHIKGAVHIPADDVAARLTELPRDKQIVCYCS